jgi:hypothetical protein
MVQADYVINSIRALITGGSVNPSTNAVRTAYACTLQRAVEDMARRVA